MTVAHAHAHGTNVVLKQFQQIQYIRNIRYIFIEYMVYRSYLKTLNIFLFLNGVFNIYF